MEEGRTNPFQGFVDMTSGMNRMRQLGMYGYDPWQEDRERTPANARVPVADVFAKRQGSELDGRGPTMRKKTSRTGATSMLIWLR